MSVGDRVLGCVVAGAVGDALGAPVEFLSIEQIRERFGPGGTSGYVGSGDITDDTQMTLFSIEGLIRAHVGGLDPVPVLQHAYQRWLHTQGIPWERAGGVFARQARPDGWLVNTPGLFAQRAPGATVLASLRAFAGGHPSPSPEAPINDSKGCGAVMRAAPFALWSRDPAEVFRVAALAGALTHGHPSGYLSAGALAVMVRALLDGADLLAATDAARAELVRWPRHEETDAALAAAVELAAEGRPTPEVIAERLGGGWVGEEALAIALCAALVSRDLADGLLVSVNHSGDSDSTGAVCGNLLGARDGIGAVPGHWLADLELRSTISVLTGDFVLEFGPEPQEWGHRYPAW